MRVNRKSPAAIEGLEARQLLSIQAIGPEFRVNAFTHFYLKTPAIGMDADGEFVVTWWRTLEESNTQGDVANGIYARRYNAVGVAQGDEFRVNTVTSNFQNFPAIGVDADGDFVITWQSEFQDGSSWGIYAQRYDAAGVAQGGFGFRVNTFTSNGQFDPTIGMDAEGDFVVAWSSNAQDGSDSGVYAKRYNAAGVAQGGEFRVNTLTTSSQGSPAIGMDAGGDFVITWQSYAQDGSGSGVYAQRYDAAGVAQGSEFRVNTFTTGFQFDPAIGMDADGDFVVAWESGYGQAPGIYAQRYNASGVAQGAEFQVNSFTTGRQDSPAIGMDADGDFVVAWESYAQGGSHTGVYAQRYTVVPTVSTSSFRFATAPQRLQFTFDENVSASLGTEDLIVQNLTTMQTIPASDFSIAYDALTNTGTFSYTGSAAGIAGVLPDGNYRATLVAAGVTTFNGNPLPADHVLNFHFLQGDANHDGRVNLDDFHILAANFGRTGNATFSQADFNYDGNVNLTDFNILAGKFGQALGLGGANERRPEFGQVPVRPSAGLRDRDLAALLAEFV